MHVVITSGIQELDEKEEHKEDLGSSRSVEEK
jgi:hypothetical protein